MVLEITWQPANRKRFARREMEKVAPVGSKLSPFVGVRTVFSW
jgi:hypothetical protein